jgi:arabinosaccharide transport system substrate-binding protein
VSRIPLGKPVIVVIAIALITGITVSMQPRPQHADLEFWVFADSHAKTFRPILPAFEDREGKSVRLSLISNRALSLRLFSMFLSKSMSGEVPDAAEIEIGSVGRFFRPPADQVGFLPLNERLRTTGAREIADSSASGRAGWNARLRGTGRIFTHDGARWVENPARTQPDMWIDRIVASRFAPWTKAGVIFGVPHDVHPLTIAYRDDLFREAGIDLAACDTWAAFHEACLRFQVYWRSQGFPHRHAIELQEASPETLVLMLLQRGINPVDDFDRIHLADPKVAETVAFYARLVAGPDKIGSEAAGGMGVFAKDVEAGNLCALLMPDWRVRYVREFAPGIAGKMRMMPLPRFDPGDPRTSTWGGTMVGIPRAARDPDAAWRLIEHLYFSEEGLDARLTQTNILPPLMEQWSHPAFTEPDPYFGGQKVFALYAELAPQVPRRCVTPMTGIAAQKLSVVLNRAVRRMREGGGEGLEQACREWLLVEARDLERRMEHSRFGRGEPR